MKLDTAALVRDHLAIKAPAAPAFSLPDKPADMIRADLRGARARWIRAV